MDFESWEDMYLTPDDHRALDYYAEAAEPESCPLALAASTR